MRAHSTLFVLLFSFSATPTFADEGFLCGVGRSPTREAQKATLHSSAKGLTLSIDADPLGFTAPFSVNRISQSAKATSYAGKDAKLVLTRTNTPEVLGKLTLYDEINIDLRCFGSPDLKPAYTYGSVPSATAGLLFTHPEIASDLKKDYPNATIEEILEYPSAFSDLGNGRQRYVTRTDIQTSLHTGDILSKGPTVTITRTMISAEWGIEEDSLKVIVAPPVGR